MTIFTSWVKLRLFFLRPKFDNLLPKLFTVGVVCQSVRYLMVLLNFHSVNNSWLNNSLVSWDLSGSYNRFLFHMSIVKEISMLKNRNILNIVIHYNEYIYLWVCMYIWSYILIFHQYSFKGFFTMSDLVLLSLVFSLFPFVIIVNLMLLLRVSSVITTKMI